MSLSLLTTGIDAPTRVGGRLCAVALVVVVGCCCCSVLVPQTTDDGRVRYREGTQEGQQTANQAKNHERLTEALRQTIANRKQRGVGEWGWN
jgi:hypothetical protein